MTPEVKAVIDPMIEANPTQVTWDALVLELIARAEGRKARERHWTDLAKEPRPSQSHHVGDDPLFLRLSKGELEDYFEVTENDRQEAAKFRDRVAYAKEVAKQGKGSGFPTWMTPNVGVRTVPPFVNGLWLDLLKLTACEAPKLGTIVGANVAYRPTGRAAQVSIEAMNVPDSCVRFMRVLIGLTVAQEASPRPANFTDVVVLWLQSEVLACADRSTSQFVDSRRRFREPGFSWKQTSFIAPKRLDDLPPYYAEEAKKRRIEGNVTVTGLLTADGCFANGTVLASPSPLLSASGLLSILNWHYKPGLYDGAPMPTQFTNLVRFKLSR
jgi:hypothetical protein